MRGLRQAAWTGRVALVAITTLALVVVGALPSGAVLRPGLPAPTAPRAGNTQLILSDRPRSISQRLHRQPEQLVRPGQCWLPEN